MLPVRFAKWIVVALASSCHAFGQGLTPADATPLDVVVLDQAHLSVPAAQVEIQVGNQPLAMLSSDQTGHAVFHLRKPARYTVRVSKGGFETTVVSDFAWDESAAPSLEVTLMAAGTKESVEVHAEASAVDTAAAPVASIRTDVVTAVPSRPATVADALPLIPGVVRQPGGELQLSGTGEHRNAMIVNSADVTDPATGEFGLTVPIDIVENLNYYQTPFLAEFGRFSSGVVTVDTKRGGEKWKWELNDPLPEFNIRSWHLRGLRTATPRLNFEGPIVPAKLYFSQGLDYEVRKTPVLTLPFPFNRTKTGGVNSFSQLDWIVSAKNLLAASFHAAPQRLQFVNLNYYNPQPTTPDANTSNYTATVSDKWSILGGLWDNTVSLTRFHASVWPKGDADYVIQPQIDSGNYFAQQHRNAKRLSWSSSFAFAERNGWGTHEFKAGVYLAHSVEDGLMTEHTVNLDDTSGHLLETIAFQPGSPFHNHDIESAIFVQDHWILSPRLSLDLGLRAETQTISETLRFAPRVGVAWKPFLHMGTVIRAGAGVFYDRVPLGVYSFDRYPDRVITFYDATGAISAGPFTYINGLGEVVSHRRLTYSHDVPGNFAPRSTTGSLQIEQPLTSNVRLRIGYLHAVSSSLVILDATGIDPATNTGRMLLSGSGTGRYRQFDVTAKVRQGEKREFFFSYVRSRATGDLNDFAGYLGSFPQPIVRANSVATSPMDLPNRFLVWGRLLASHGYGMAPVFEYRNGFPYSDVNELQRYVGVPNSTRFPNFLSLDARVWRDVKVSSKYSVRLSVSSFNLTNHFNPEATHWNTADPAYGVFFGERHRRFTADFDVFF